MAHGLFLKHTALPGRRGDLIAAWRAHMPAAVAANPGHEDLAASESLLAHPPEVVPVTPLWSKAVGPEGSR